jgi:hypothetical protein
VPGSGPTEPAPPAIPGTPPAKPPRRGRGCCLSCLASLLILILALGLLAWWVSRGPAPAPADCLPPDAPVQAVFRDPADAAGRFLTDERWRAVLAAIHDAEPAPPGQPQQKLPGRDELGWPLFLMGQILGEEVGLAGGPGRGLVGASRMSLAARMAERLFRSKLRSDPKVHYGLVGRTLVFSDAAGASDLQAVLARRGEIPAAGGAGALASGLAAEVRLRGLQPAECGADAQGLRAAAFLLDVPSAARISGVLQLDRAIEKLSGHLDFPPDNAEAGGFPPAPALLPEAGPASARLVADDALAYWVWSAPAGRGRWNSAGRLARLEELLPDVSESLNKLRDAGTDFRKVLEEQLVGERAIVVSAQAREGGKPLMAAATLMFECREPEKVWPQVAKVLAMSFEVSTDGQPPRKDGLPVYPHFVERRHKGWPYLELVYAHYPHGSGYRPAFGTVGRFLVATTSRTELERMLDRTDTVSGRTLASRGDLTGTGAGGARLSSLLVVRPGGRGRELSDLGLALTHDFSEPGKEPGPDAARKAAALGEVLSKLKSLRAEWQPGQGGLVRIEVGAEIVSPARK